MNEYLTLAEALATKLPFRRVGFDLWSDDSCRAGISYTHNLYSETVYERMWEVRQDPKPLMKVWGRGNAHNTEITICDIQPSNWHRNITPELAEALAPHLKELLK
jgi:hypothetical protein